MIRITRAFGAPIALAAILACLPAAAFAGADIAKLTADANAGIAEAQFQLGNAYLRGDGVPADPVASARWCQMAAEQGYAQAEAQLAMKLGNGNGVAKDRVEGDKWMILASRADSHNVNLLRMYESQMSPDDLQKGHAAADQWQAAHANSPKTSAN